MRATLNLPDGLVSELMKWTDRKTKTEAIAAAVEEYIKKKKIERLLSLKGKVDIEDNWRELEELELKAMKEREKLYARLRRGR